MILVDANVLIDAAGAEHENREPSLDFPRRVAECRIPAVLDAETLQEVLHATGRYAAGRRAGSLT